MNRLQLLLAKLAEEGTEVAHIALKTAQFGPSMKSPEQPLTNVELAHRELDDLWAAVEMLNEECGFGYSPNPARIAEKKDKVNRFARVSESLGSAEPREPAEPPSLSLALTTTLHYRGVEGSMELDLTTFDWFGRVHAAGSTAYRYRADTVAALKAEFRTAVNRYLDGKR
jgi:hypothetical protein